MATESYFNGKVIWVTGASSGIGEALVRKLAEWEVKLIISSRRIEELERVKKKCGAGDEKMKILPLDLSDPTMIEKAADEALNLLGRIDILFNNGGVSQRSLATETTIETDRKIMEVNYFSGVILTKKVLPGMIERGFGHIVAVSSLTGKFGLPYRSAYAASKHALQGYYETVWTELQHKGIRTTVVFPGRVKTNVSVNAFGPGGLPWGKMDEGQEKGISAEKCAMDILKGVSKNKREVLSGSSDLMGVYIKRFWPWLFYRLILKTNPL
jgi:dehydrogenase/reductase SDR family member 7B